MPKLSLKILLDNYIEEFQQHNSINALNVQNGLKNLPKELDNDDLINWWRQQDLSLVASLQSYMFWMWTNKKIENQLFEGTYDTLTPLVSKSWNMPIEITTGLELAFT